MSTEQLPVLFRGRSADEAIQHAKAWAHDEGLTLRTIASCRRRTDIPEWTPEGPAWEVDLVVLLRDATRLPEPPTLWGTP